MFCVIFFIIGTVGYIVGGAIMASAGMCTAYAAHVLSQRR